MLKNPLVIFGLIVTAGFVYLVFFYDSPDYPEWTLDVCNYERVFNNCMNAAMQTGVSSTNFVSQCSDVAHNASMRHKPKVKPECQK